MQAEKDSCIRANIMCSLHRTLTQNSLMLGGAPCSEGLHTWINALLTILKFLILFANKGRTSIFLVVLDTANNIVSV